MLVFGFFTKQFQQNAKRINLLKLHTLVSFRVASEELEESFSSDWLFSV